MKALAPIRVADLFCGAGGFSTALLEALGEDRVKLVALNHWDRAIETHNANHPGGFLADLYDADPLAFVPEGKLDLLVASPTCTFFSRARGGKPVSWDQRKGRMTPTQVTRWCKALKPTCLIVENVPEFLDWGPISRETGKPRKERKGCNFRGFVRDLEELGFKVQWRILNAADFGDATTRTRFFLMARSDGGLIRWPKATHAKTFASPGLKRWRAAREVINWKRRGKSIFKRKKPLAAKTLLRIYAGIVRFGWPLVFRVKLALYMQSLGIEVPDVGSAQGELFDPAVIVLRKHADMRSIDSPLPAVCAGGTHLGVVEPFVLNRHGENGSRNSRGRSVDAPLPTTTAQGGGYVVEPFLLPQHFGNPARSIDLPAPPPVAIDRTALVEPFLFPTNQGTERARGLRSVDDPLDTIVTKDFKGLVEPFTFANRSGNAPRGSGEPIAPPVTSGGIGLVEPFMLSQGAGGAPRATSAPVPTIPTEGAHSLIAPYYGASECASIEDPLGTVTTRDRFAIVTPVTHDDVSMRSRSTDDPLPTVTGAARGELAFIVGAFGERPGQTPRVHSIDEPAPTLCAKGRIPLVHGVTLEQLDAIDILFRMLEPDELALAMGFPKRYCFKGNKTERTRQIGNAVAVNTARALVAALMEIAA